MKIEDDNTRISDKIVEIKAIEKQGKYSEARARLQELYEDVFEKIRYYSEIINSPNPAYNSSEFARQYKNHMSQLLRILEMWGQELVWRDENIGGRK